MLILLNKQNKLKTPWFYLGGMRAIQSVVRFFADCRIKHHASLRLLQNRLIFLFSLLQVYWQGGMFIVFHFDTRVITRASYIHRLRSGVQRSLIFFPAPTFVPQRQSLMEDGLRLQFSTEYLRISSLHLAFNQPLLDSSFNVLKLPAHPLCQFKMTNVRVSGVTESAGTRFWTTLLLRVYHFCFLRLDFLFFQLARSLLRALTNILGCCQYKTSRGHFIPNVANNSFKLGY